MEEGRDIEISSVRDSARGGEPPEKKAKHDDTPTGRNVSEEETGGETSARQKYAGEKSMPPVKVCGLSGEVFTIEGCRTVGNAMAKIAIRRSRFANQIVIVDPTSGRNMAADDGILPDVQFVINDDAAADLESTKLNLLLHAEQGDRAACARLLGILKKLSHIGHMQIAESVLWDALAHRGRKRGSVAKTLMQVGVPGERALLKAAELGLAGVLEVLLTGGHAHIQESDKESGTNMSATECQASMLEAVVDRAQPENDKLLMMTREEGERGSVLVGKLLAARADPNYVYLENTPLALAAIQGNTKIVAQLLKAAANVNFATKKNSFTALMLAAAKGHTNVVEVLIAARANIEHQLGLYSYELTPARNRAGAAPAPATGLNIEYTNSEGNTALNLAVSNGHVHATDILLAAGASVNHANREKMSTLVLALAKYYVAIEVRFVGRHSPVSALMLAACDGHTSIVDKLLVVKANVNFTGYAGQTALTLACRHPICANMVDKLLAAGANVNLGYGHGSTPLMRAIEFEDIDIVGKLLAAKANIHHVNVENGRSCLMVAARFGHTKLVEVLLAQSANVHQVNLEGHTALSLALTSLNRHFNCANMVDKLLASGANIHHTDCKGNTPLLVALGVRGDVDEVVEKLLTAQADINHVNHDSDTALMVASYTSRDSIVAKLIASGANVDTVNSRGETALICAVSDGYDAVVDQLLAAGAHINHAQRDGETAFSIASKNGEAALVAKLVAADAHGSTVVQK